jgi:hypothetical protein
VQAVRQSIRERGLSALHEAINKERLKIFDAEARRELHRWIENTCSEIT